MNAQSLRLPTAPVGAPAEREFVFTDEDFFALASLINQETGIVIDERKRSLLYGRLAKRLRHLGLTSFAAYRARLDGDDREEELKYAVNAMTTNLTRFFREGEHFEHLAKEALPTLAKNPANRRLRIWSSACSSGEEPYSIAMSIADVTPTLGMTDAMILATDLDTDMINRGRRAIYTEKDVASIPPPFRDRFTAPVAKGSHEIKIAPAIAQRVVFNPLNLLRPWPMKGRFQVIFCRNALIYFDHETQAQLLSRFADALIPDGFLYLGHSENVGRLADRFRLIGRTTYRRIA